MSERPARCAYKPIGDYGLIGNSHSAGLVGLDGALDWCCFPRFDSPSVFAALLDAEKGGRFAIAPRGAYSSIQRYVGDTNVLETRFVAEGGVCTLQDCMPLYLADDGGPVEVHQVIRLLRCEQGTVTLDVDYAPRPDYGRAPVSLVRQGPEVRWTGNGRMLTLRADTPLGVAGDRATGSLTLREGEEALFVLSYSDATTDMDPDPPTPRERVARTLRFWEDKASQVDFHGPWRDEVVRSYLLLHLLTYVPTGAIVAAPTTSLPEEIGGVRNWDYRYTWLRDAAFTVDALTCLGHRDEATAFFMWLGRVCSLYGEDLRIMYRVDAQTDLLEEGLAHLEGYRGSTPVRIGNGANGQVQLDVYGEVLASASLQVDSGEALSDEQWLLLRTLANLAAARWRQPDSGIWEVRGGPFHFVHSKVMCWVALDRAASLARLTGRAGPESEGWERVAHAIKDEVLERGWSAEKQAFVQHYDTDALDASNLLIPLVGFLPFDDPRVVSTVGRIREELGRGPFLRRYLPEETDDGLTGEEGAFTLCSFWLVRVLAGMGLADESMELFRELMGFASPLGLFSEMVDPDSGSALGNYPQAFTHIGLILAARDCRGAAEGD